MLCPPPGDFPNPEIEPRSPALQADSLLSEPPARPKNTGVGSLSLLQGIFPAQESNQGLLPRRQILYQLSYQGSPGYEHSNCQFDFSCSCRALAPSFSSPLLLLVSCPAPATWWRQQLCRPLRDALVPALAPSALSQHVPPTLGDSSISVLVNLTKNTWDQRREARPFG